MPRWFRACLAACLLSTLPNLAAAQIELDFGGGCVPADDLLDFLEEENSYDIFIDVEGTDAYLDGEITDAFPCKIEYLTRHYPKVDTLVLVYVPGSLDDDSNLEAARMIRRAGLNTHVLADSELASGGVDLFLAGVERTGEAGAYFGVHEWADSDGTTAADTTRDNPVHQIYLSYFIEMGIDPAFYWFTLEAAPAEGMHEMTDAELQRFGFFTD